MLSAIRQKVVVGERLNRDEGLFLLQEVNLLDLAPLAQEVRYRLNPQPVVTFVVDTNLNYTNVCDAYCTFCAFYRTERDADAYTHSVDDVMGMIGAAAEKGVTTVLMQGGLNSKLPLSYYTELLRECRRRYPQVHPHFFSAPEVMKMSHVSGLSVRDVLAELKDAGLESIPWGRLRNPFQHRQVQDKSPLPEGYRRPVDTGASRGPSAGSSHHRHHDVRPPGEGRRHH